MNEKEFTEFVAGTKKIVLAAIRRYLNPALSHAVDDVAQETYLRVFRFIEKRGQDAIQQEKINAWVYTIARNESQRMNESMNRENKRLQLVQNLQPTHATTTAGDSARHTLPGLDEITDFETDDRSLREILQLRAQGYRIREIASMLKIPEGTIKSRLARFKKRHELSIQGAAGL